MVNCQLSIVNCQCPPTSAPWSRIFCVGMALGETEQNRTEQNKRQREEEEEEEEEEEGEGDEEKEHGR